MSAVSGREERLAKHLQKEWARAQVLSDALGNVIARIPGEEEIPGVMLAAHMDEIGLVVKDIDDSGAIRVAAVGGIHLRTLPATEVIVHGRKDLPGMIGTIPPHLTSAQDRSRLPDLDDLFIDVGYDREALLEKVRPGDPVSFLHAPSKLMGDRLSAKSLDNRAGLAAVMLCAEKLLESPPGIDVYVAATSQEEVGLRGAATAAFKVSPYVAIAVDVGFGSMPGLPKRDTIDLGKGPAITVGPNIHSGVRQELLAAAAACEVSVQTEVAPGSSGTDAWAMQVSGRGVATGVVSIPLRYMHSTVETVSISDIAQTAVLLETFCRRITPELVRRWHGGSSFESFD